MTDRHAGYIVTLATDVREDDAEQILNAIRMLKGVLGVEPVVMDSAIHIATMRAEHKFKERLARIFDRDDTQRW